MADRIVTLTSDIGSSYAAQIKGVLCRYLPPARVVDLVQDLRPHGIVEAGFLLRHMGARFPAGTVHLAIVDPGVGGDRSPVAVECVEGSYLVGPDNGLLAPLAEHLGVRSVVRLDPARVGGPGRVSATFEGRDLFAPAAGRLASGEPIRSLGPRTRLAVGAPPPPTGSSGTVVHVDRFGNLITDLPPDAAPSVGGRVGVRFARRRAVELLRARTYSDARAGKALLLVSSFGTLEISVAEGNASTRFRVGPGTGVELPRGRSANR